MAKKKTSQKQKSFSEAIGIKNILDNETSNFFLGLIILALAILSTVSMVSYFTTGQVDQSILENMRPGDWVNSSQQLTNACGSIGSLLAYYLLYVHFGLASFLIPAFLVLVGLRLMRVYEVVLWKWFFGLMLVMVWLSVTLAKFATPFCGGLLFNPGGGHGLLCVRTMENLIGAPGLTAILAIVALAFLTYLSAETIEMVRKALNPVKYLTSKVKLTVSDHTHRPDDADTVENGPYESTVTGVDDDYNAHSANGADDADNANTVDLTDMAGSRQTAARVRTAPDEVPFTIENGSDIRTSDGDTIVEGNIDDKQISQEQKAEGDILTQQHDLAPINPWEPFVNYKFPGTNLLKRYDNNTVVDMEEVKANNARIVEVLNSFGVSISKINATVGPTITLYEIVPAEGMRISKIKGLEADIAMNLSALGIRIIAPMPGKGTIGIEVPNKNPQIVSMESVLNTKKFQNTTMALPMALGKTITNEVFMADLAKCPHLLVAGATGQGKSVGLNAIITSLLYKKHPNELKFVLVDPKKVEFSVYNKIAPHYMASLPENDEEPIITDTQKVVRTLNSLCKLMDTRYDLLKKAQVRKIDEYNEKYLNHRLRLTDGHHYMPYIVVIVDEFGDLIMTAGKEIEMPIQRIAQLARAVGIHMIIATQRPTTKIITGNIKANFPARIAFRVTSQIDSRTILDAPGADQLVGRGDMLYLGGAEPIRLQCAFVDTPEIESINTFVADQVGPVDMMELPEPDDPNGGADGAIMTDAKTLDSLFDEAAHAIVSSQLGSTSMIQRRFSIGYNRAGRLMDQLEKAGIVGTTQGSKPREVLITDENSLNQLLMRIHGVGG